MWHPFGKSKKIQIIGFSDRLSSIVGWPGHDGYVRWETENYHIDAVLRSWWRTHPQNIWEVRPSVEQVTIAGPFLATNLDDFPRDWYVKLKGVSTQILPSPEDQTKVLHELIIVHNKPKIDTIMEREQKKREPTIPIENRFELLDIR